MKRPGLTPIAIQKGSMFYVTWTSLDPWVRAIVKAHKLTAVRLKFSLSTDCLFHDPSILKLCSSRSTARVPPRSRFRNSALPMASILQCSSHSGWSSAMLGSQYRIRLTRASLKQCKG